MTIISNKLVEKWEPYDQAFFKIETMNGATLTHSDLVRFNLQPLFSDETFALSNVVTHSPWYDDMNTLPHRQDMSTFAHFKDVELFELPENKTVDLLIGNDNAFLMTVLEERVVALRSDPNAILAPLRWLGCGGRSPLEESPIKVCRVQACVNMTAGVTECPKIMARDNRIRELEQALKNVTSQDAEIDCSRSDKEARQLVESNVIVNDSRFEIPVPLKEGVEALPNNLALAQNRLEILRKKAMKDDDLRVFLTQSFSELQDSNYIELVYDGDKVKKPVWYLPYFVTSQAKKRIVYDGRAEFDGVCVNEFIETGPDLLNSLADILTRFRLGKFGMMADLTKCFFQIGLPEDQRDLFRILWFDNIDISQGKLVKFRFTRHPWGEKQSFYCKLCNSEDSGGQCYRSIRPNPRHYPQKHLHG